MNREKRLTLIARTLSLVFNPFYLPLVGLVALFWFSYLDMLPLFYKLSVTGLVYLWTILLPSFLIRLYTNYHGWKLFELRQQERRMLPYIISIVCYFACCYIMDFFHIPHFMSSILVAALVLQIICAVVNVWWKISTHTAAIGAFTGGIVVFSFIFGFYLLWWLCLLLIISGMVATSRLILRQHSLSQVLVGYALGFITTILILLYL